MITQIWNYLATMPTWIILIQVGLLIGTFISINPNLKSAAWLEKLFGRYQYVRWFLLRPQIWALIIVATSRIISGQ
jgi:hypothetical protein